MHAYKEAQTAPEPGQVKALLLWALELFGAYVLKGQEIPRTEVLALRHSVGQMSRSRCKADRDSFRRFRSDVGSMAINNKLIVADANADETLMWLLFGGLAVKIYKSAKLFKNITGVSVKQYNVQSLVGLIKQAALWLDKHRAESGIREALYDFIENVYRASGQKQEEVSRAVTNALYELAWQRTRPELDAVFMTAPSADKIRDELEECRLALHRAGLELQDEKIRQEMEEIKREDNPARVDSRQDSVIRRQLTLVNEILYQKRLMNEAEAALKSAVRRRS